MMTGHIVRNGLGRISRISWIRVREAERLGHLGVPLHESPGGLNAGLADFPAMREGADRTWTRSTTKVHQKQAPIVSLSVISVRSLRQSSELGHDIKFSHSHRILCGVFRLTPARQVDARAVVLLSWHVIQYTLCYTNNGS
jgi:hypothetical protein